MAEPAQQCTATSRKGTRCKRPAVRGATVCRYHGGAAPQVRAAADRRVARETALAWATGEVERLHVERTPLEHLEAVLEEDARTYAIWDTAVQALTRDGSTLLGKNRHGEEQIHPYVEERDRAAQRWARSAKYALDAGVAERRLELAKSQAVMWLGAIRGAFALLGLTREQQQRGLAHVAHELQSGGGPPDIELPAAA